MRGAVLGATFRRAWVDAWEAIGYGWAFFRREWRALLWAYLPFFALVAIVQVGMAYENTLAIRRMLGHASSGGIDAVFGRVYLNLAHSILFFGLLAPLYAYVAGRLKNRDPLPVPVPFLSAWRRYYLGFTLAWLITLLPRSILYAVMWYAVRSRTNGSDTPDLYLLAVPAMYLILAPFLAPLLFILVIDGKGISRALKEAARLFVRNYVALVVLIAVMQLCVSGVRSIPEVAFGLVEQHLTLPQAAGQFDPSSFIRGVRKTFVRNLEYGPALPDRFIQGTPAGAIADRIFRARLLPQVKPSPFSPTDNSAWWAAYIAYGVVTWLIILAMFFIYVPTMFYWVKKRLGEAAGSPATETLAAPIASAP